MSYDDQLNDPRWLARRIDILERDDYCCQDCLQGRRKTRFQPTIELQVHHKKYLDGLMAWEYPDHLLITLCDECHGKLHGKVEDLRPDRLKPTFVYDDKKFESRPVKHIRDVILDMIQAMRDGK